MPSAVDRRTFLEELAAGGFVLTGANAFAAASPVASKAKRPAGEATTGSWYENSFYLLHEDHHTSSGSAVGRGADPAETERLINLSRPDVIQIHAKGRPGWTTYPSKIGHTSPKLARDVLGLWRDIARKNGYHFSAYYNIGRDGEIQKRRPEWNRVDANGEPWETALCYHSGVAQAYLWPMIDEIMDRYKPDGFWFDGSCFTVSVCYCAKCRERFGRETGLEAPTTPREKGWAAFKEMQRQVYREFVRQTLARIKAKDPKCLVAVNWSYSLLMPEEPDAGIGYLSGDRGNHVDFLSRDAHWYDSQGKPFDLMTTIFVHEGNDRRPKPAEQIEQEMAIVVANGGRYFAWDNPTPESGLVAERHEFLGKVVAPFLRARQKWCLGSARLPDVSLLNSAADHYATTVKTPKCFVIPDIQAHGAAEALCRAHLNYEMISDARLERRDIRSPLLIVDDPAALGLGGAQALRRYVEGGGNLLMTGLGFSLASLADLFGIELAENPAIKEKPEDWDVSLNGRAFKLRHVVRRVRLSGAEAPLSAKDGKGREYPLFTRRRVGKGQALCVPFAFMSQAKDCETPPALISWILDTAAPSAQRQLTADAPATVETVLRRKDEHLVLHLVNRARGKREVFPQKDKNEPHYRITNIPPAPPCHISIRLEQRPAAVTLEPEGTVLAGWTWQDGRLYADVPEFAIHQMVAVQLAK